MKADILAIGVHPDDIELCCSGTLLLQIRRGRQVALLDLTKGELGTRGSADLRMKEAEDARRMMGAFRRTNAGLKDGFFYQDEDSIRGIIPHIRSCRPDIVLANAIEDRHPDHGRAAKLTADACFYSGLVKIPNPPGSPDAAERWRPRALYHYIQDYYIEPDIVIDITPVFQKKMELIRCYRSQFYDPDSKELESPISGVDFFDYIESRARQFGRYIGVEYAEGFTLSRPAGVPDLLSLQ